jgi:hypothetical protein
MGQDVNKKTGSTNIHTDSDILKQLDTYAEENDFPMPDNTYFYNTDMRLKAFRSPTEWLIVFEEIALLNQYMLVNTVN